MGKIVLYDLLMIMTGGKNDKNKTPYTLINTNNLSFPNKYRYCQERPADFFTTLIKDNDPYNLLDREVDYISMLPSNVCIDSGNLYPIILDYNSGFIKSSIRNGSGITDREQLCPDSYRT